MDKTAGMTATLVVAKIEGPVVAGVLRGVRFMEMGLNQQGEFLVMQGICETAGVMIKSSPGRRKSPLGFTNLGTSSLVPDPKRHFI
jgi:hypothetical protein